MIIPNEVGPVTIPDQIKEGDKITIKINNAPMYFKYMNFYQFIYKIRRNFDTLEAIGVSNELSCDYIVPEGTNSIQASVEITDNMDYVSDPIYSNTVYITKDIIYDSNYNKLLNGHYCLIYKKNEPAAPLTIPEYILVNETETLKDVLDKITKQIEELTNRINQMEKQS